MTDPWGSQGGSLETGNAAAELQVFFEDKGFQHAPAISSGAPFGCERKAVSARKRADCVRCAEEQASAESRGPHGHSGLQSLGSRGDEGGNAPAHCCLSLHCSCCCQQTSHSSAAAVGDGVVAVGVVSSVTSLTVCLALRLTPQTLYYPHHH